jgi:hypothetical protein
MQVNYIDIMLEAFALGSIHKPSLSQDNKFQFYLSMR